MSDSDNDSDMELYLDIIGDNKSTKQLNNEDDSQEYVQEYVQEYINADQGGGDDNYEDEYIESDGGNDEGNDEEYNEGNGEYDEGINNGEEEHGVNMREERNFYDRVMTDKDKFYSMYGNINKYASVEQRFKSLVYITLNLIDEGELIEIYERYIDKIEDLSIINPICLVLGFKCLKKDTINRRNINKEENLIDITRFDEVKNLKTLISNKFNNDTTNNPNIKNNDIIRYARYCEKLIKK